EHAPIAVALAKMAQAIQLFRVMISSRVCELTASRQKKRTSREVGITRRFPFLGSSDSILGLTRSSNAISRASDNARRGDRGLGCRRWNGGLRPDQGRGERDGAR